MYIASKEHFAWFFSFGTSWPNWLALHTAHSGEGKSGGDKHRDGCSYCKYGIASIPALGVSAVSAFLLNQQTLLRLVGTAFLFYLGVKTFFKKPAGQAANLPGETLKSMYASTFLLMITNPVTILNFTAMFAGLGIEESTESQGIALSLITGVAIGAAAWWVLLSVMVSRFRRRITPHLGLVNKLAGLLIIILGIASFIN
ncbi:LysE family translocator [Bacillus sp. FJAT-18017]|uniref:LysE family translocator n=1 Tax=Bacillus sp. FJAT-18017 TaxID=1705566 RepID=UPI000AE716C9|nr:LysE family transporter [Bacillus sp. FJAT-18017]